MTSIQVLAPEVVDQIAAGEVVDRPAHLVKELVENSLDAGASAIEVEVDFGGRYVRVTDDGIGMSPDDLKLSLTRHATSKIFVTDDLWRLKSYGFRGEALASIASVCRMQITTRMRSAEFASSLRCEFGQISEIKEAGGSFGTTILVQDLFENLPVRLKFLKSAASELSQIKLALKALALANLDKKFVLKQGGKLLALWPGRADEDWKKAVEVIMDVTPMYFEKLSDGDLTAEIFFSSPSQVVRNSRDIWTLVQGRWVVDKTMQAAVMDSYRSLLMHGEYPSVVVRLNCAPDFVDVNVHPTKSQVKFSESAKVFRIIQKTLRAGIEKTPWLKKIEPTFGSYETKTMSFPLTQNESYQNQTKPTLENFVRAPVTPYQATEVSTSVVASTVEARTEIKTPGVWSRFQIIGQSHLTYIICQDADGITLVDQHAAHERVMFEQLMSDWKHGTVKEQILLLPLTVDLNEEEADILLSQTQELIKFGIHLDRLAPTVVSIRAIPSGFSETAVVTALKKMAQELNDLSGSFAIEKMVADISARLACHSAIRAGQALSVDEMRALLQQMDQFSLSSYCPHGRPVSIQWNLGKIEREFGRIV